MREYKFRGKENSTGRWVYGGLFKEPAPPQCFEKTLEDKYWIVYPNPRFMPDWNLPFDMVRTDVDKNTIGQFTGLHDKNGKEIWEGDIVNCQTKYGKAKAIIKLIDGKFVAYWDSRITHPKNGHHIACYDINKRFEVIGNVFDNEELLNETDR